MGHVIINTVKTNLRTLEHLADDGGLFLIEWKSQRKDSPEIVCVTRRKSGMLRIDGIGWGSDNPKESSLISIKGRVILETLNDRE